METGQISQIDVEGLLSGLRAESEALLTCLRAGGVGASALAETLYHTARTVENHVDWNQPAELDGEGAMREGEQLLVSLVENTLTFNGEPRTLSFSRIDPQMETLSICWSGEGSLSIEHIDEEIEVSWTVMSDGTCLDEDEFDQAQSENIQSFEPGEPPSTRAATDAPSETGQSDWMEDLAGDLFKGLAAVATATAVGAAKRARKKVKETMAEATETATEPAPPPPESDTQECPKCKGSCPAGSVFCPHCGHQFQQKEVCVKCGVELVEGANFCAQCGTPVANSRPTNTSDTT